MHTDPQEEIRVSAAWATRVVLGREVAIPTLIGLLREEESEQVRKVAGLFLGFLTQQDFDQDADAWQTWWDAQP